MKCNNDLHRYTLFSPKIKSRNTIGGSRKGIGFVSTPDGLSSAHPSPMG